MVEHGPKALAQEFRADSTRIKTTTGHSPTLDEMEATRQEYLDLHPEYRDYEFKSSVVPNPAPTPKAVHDGTYIHDRWDEASKRWKENSLARRNASSPQDTSVEDALPTH